ncbi:hypothetical protein HHK36_022856 [Tetracentron sinense]|uniref:Uncharacterized protein n=1 Tax=Tetracentron sinense TaxID=13715 RepID=A0A834YTZ7_TETSI|nr:hypothetical protein HHK36_022856 [Tetracentron sinense]
MGGTTTQTVSSSSLTGVGNLIKLLPTGTVFLFQFFNPVLTNNGQCDTINKYLTSILLGVCGLSCIFSSFTDSYPGSDGVTHYGVVTLEGLWTLSDSGSENLSGYHLRKTDFVHAFLAVTVFMVVVLMEPNTVKCFYPSFESTQTTLLKVLPIIVGVLSSSVFAYVPCKRHGIGKDKADVHIETERPILVSHVSVAQRRRPLPLRDLSEGRCGRTHVPLYKEDEATQKHENQSNAKASLPFKEEDEGVRRKKQP